MPETELLIRKAETLPNALFEEAVHYRINPFLALFL